MAASRVAPGVKAEPPERPPSPEQSCAICLGPPENKSFTDSCFHTFCFSCLLEWSKVKAECPLCKQRFKSIVHNVRSFEDYDRYFVTTSSGPSATGGGSSGASSSHAATALGSALLLAHHLVYSSPLLGGDQWISRHMFTWRPPRRRATRTTPRRPRVGRPSAVAAAAQLSPLPSSSGERRSLYELDLWVCPPNNRRSARHFTPAFFRDNPACTHRLMPWLDRELQALLGAQQAFATELVLTLITRYEVCSAEFAEHVRPFFGARTAHFLHELAAFVASPLDMVAYDRVAVYDSAANVVARGSPAAQFLAPPSDDEDALTRPPVALVPRDPSEPGPSGLHHGTTVDLVAVASESDDSDCVVVTSVLPPQPRTPVVIELSSSSSDGEDGAGPSMAAAGAAVVPRPQPSRRCKLFAQRPSKFWSGDSDSSSESDSDYEEARLQARRLHRKTAALVHRQRASAVAKGAGPLRPPEQPASPPGHRRKRPRRAHRRRRVSEDD